MERAVVINAVDEVDLSVAVEVAVGQIARFLAAVDIRNCLERSVSVSDEDLYRVRIVVTGRDEVKNAVSVCIIGYEAAKLCRRRKACARKEGAVAVTDKHREEPADVV